MYETINSSVNYGGLELKTASSLPDDLRLVGRGVFGKIAASLRAAAPWSSSVMCLWAKSMIEKSLFDKKGFAYYQKLTEIVHSYDCRICAQLHQSDSNMLAMLKYVPAC